MSEDHCTLDLPSFVLTEGDQRLEFETRVIRVGDGIGIQQMCLDSDEHDWDRAMSVVVIDRQWDRVVHWIDRMRNLERAALPSARDTIDDLMAFTIQAVREAEKGVDDRPHMTARYAFERAVLVVAWSMLPDDPQAMLEGLQDLGEILKDISAGLDLPKPGER